MGHLLQLQVWNMELTTVAMQINKTRIVQQYSQPDNNNNGSNSLLITSTLANEPDEEAELLKENEATKEKGGKITNFLNKCKDLRLTKKMVKRKLSGKRPPTKTKTNGENG